MLVYKVWKSSWTPGKKTPNINVLHSRLAGLNADHCTNPHAFLSCNTRSDVIKPCTQHYKGTVIPFHPLASASAWELPQSPQLLALWNQQPIGAFAMWHGIGQPGRGKSWSQSVNWTQIYGRPNQFCRAVSIGSSYKNGNVLPWWRLLVMWIEGKSGCAIWLPVLQCIFLGSCCAQHRCRR